MIRFINVSALEWANSDVPESGYFLVKLPLQEAAEIEWLERVELFSVSEGDVLLLATRTAMVTVKVTRVRPHLVDDVE